MLNGSKVNATQNLKQIHPICLTSDEALYRDVLSGVEILQLNELIITERPNCVVRHLPKACQILAGLSRAQKKQSSE